MLDIDAYMSVCVPLHFYTLVLMRRFGVFLYKLYIGIFSQYSRYSQMCRAGHVHLSRIHKQQHGGGRLRCNTRHWGVFIIIYLAFYKDRLFILERKTLTNKIMLNQKPLVRKSKLSTFVPLLVRSWIYQYSRKQNTLNLGQYELGIGISYPLCE